MKPHVLFATAMLLFAPVVGCIGEAEDAASLGEAEIALASVPTGVRCIHIDATAGGGGSGQSFTVAEGASPVRLALGALPTGVVQFTGAAYNAACPDAVSAPMGMPSWIADPVAAQLAPGLPASIAFTFHRNLPSSGTADFVDSALSIAPGSGAVLALMADGTLRGWGTTSSGEFGNNKLTDTSPTPTAAGLGLTDLNGVATTYGRACAWRGGQLWCWGAHYNGSLGDGSATATRATPTLIAGGWGEIADVELGGNMTCLLAKDSRAWCWGANPYGQIGRPATTTSFSTPQEQSGRYEAIAVGGNSVCGIVNSGSVECWGLNNTRQLGSGSTEAQSDTPRFTGVRGAVDIAVSSYHACAVRADGTVWCWGSNSIGQIGNGTTTQAPTPVQVLGIYDAVAVAVTNESSCALRRDGSALCWGVNLAGQLGTGNGINTTLPAVVLNLNGAVDLRSNANGMTVCATLADGAGRCWGWGILGQIGDGGKSNRFVPTRVDF